MKNTTATHESQCQPAGRSKPGTPLHLRIRSKIAVTDTDCWEWQGATSRDGYGQIKVDGQVRLAHRVSFEAHVGVLAGPDVVLDHLCKNRCCVNWRHLDPVSQVENIRRGDSPVGIIMRRCGR